MMKTVVVSAVVWRERLNFSVFEHGVNYIIKLCWILFFHGEASRILVARIGHSLN